MTTPAEPATPTAVSPWASPVRGALSLYRRRPLLWLALSSPYLAAGLLAALAATTSPTSQRTFYALYCGYRPLRYVLDIAVGVGLLALMVGIAREAAACPTPGPREALRRVWRRLWPTLVVGVVIGTVWSAVVLASVALASRGENVPLRADHRLYGAVLVVAFLLLVRFGFSVEAALLRHDEAITAFKHGWALTRGRATRVAGYLLLMSTPLLILSVARWLPIASDLPRLTTDLVTTVLGYLWLPFATALHVLLWYKLRQDHESLTARTVAAELGIAPASRPRAAPATETADPPRRRRRRR